MKNIFRLLMAVLVLSATSCTTEDVTSTVVGNGELIEVNFSASMVDGTRATTGDGSAVTTLHYNVYDAESNTLLTSLCDTANLNTEGKFTFNIAMVKGMIYDIVLWADCGEGSIYKLNGKTITAKYDNVLSNNEAHDAFYKFVDNFNPLNPTTTHFTLTRPFAQLNAATLVKEITDLSNSGIKVETLTTTITLTAHKMFDIESGTTCDENASSITFEATGIKDTVNFNGNNKYAYLTANYLFVPKSGALTTAKYEFKAEKKSGNDYEFSTTYASIPLKQNYRTNILGSLLTKSTEFTVDIDADWNGVIDNENGENTITVNNATAFAEAIADENMNVIVLEDDIDLNEVLTRTADVAYTIQHGKTLTIDLNSYTLSATSTQSGKNYNMFTVYGTLTVKNGTIEYEHKGENMGWNSSTNIFHVEGGILNLNGVTAKNNGGSDMGFVAHLNNWSNYDLTLNVENSTLESNYVAVRVFNSGPRMNNVTIKESTLKGGNYAFWVHNYTVADFGTEAKAEAQKALLNLNIYNQGNTFSPDVNGIRYGFTNPVKTDARGITKTVSEDGTVVTLGSIVENGLIRRGVAGDEENTTITKVVVEEGVGVLYDRTFRRFYALETVELPSTLTTIGAAGSGVFQSCSNLKNIVLPESVTVLGKGSFQECTSLESINIPAGVTRIESDCLRNTGLVEVEFHAGVTYFGAQAFRDCKKLTKVVINAPEFTMEGNTFGIMAAPYTPMTIEVANAEMKAYVESKLTANCKTYITVVAPELINNTADLQVALAEGKNVALANDLTITPEEMKTAPYGNKMALSQNGGVLNGNGKNISVTANGDNYVVMTAGGTIKNLDIDRGFRGIVLMSPNQDVYVDNVKIGVDDEVCYTINTAEGDSTHNLYVSNSVLNGWCSIGTAVKFVSFTNCTFGQGTYYTNVYGRLVKPYVNALFDGCDFCSKAYLDLSAFEGTKVTLKNCTVNGVKLTAESWTSLVAPEDSCGEGQISIELKNGSYMTAENVADYVVFE